VLHNAGDLSVLENVAALGMGQYWYVFVATFGLVALGLVQVAARLSPDDPAARRRWPRWAASRESGGAAAVGVFLIGSGIGLAVLVGLYLRPPVRPDHLVYGRYLEILVPPLLAMGLMRLWTTRLRRVALELAAGAALALLAALTVTSYAGGLIARGPVNWSTVLALPPLAQRQQIRPLAATLLALAGTGVLVVVTRRSRGWGRWASPVSCWSPASRCEPC
jgi:hypothetical protein